MLNTMPRVQARLADVVPVEPHEEREGPEKERLEHADLDVRRPHPKSARRVTVVSRRDDRVGRH